MRSFPLDISSLAFLALVIGLSAGLVLVVRQGTAERGERASSIAVVVAAILLALWLGTTGLLAWRGFFLVTDALPPRFLILLAPPLALIVGGLFSSSVRRAIGALPATVLIGFQSFRVLMEWILHSLYRDGTVAALMTFEGRNFDIVTGLSAPFVAVFVARRAAAARTTAIVWNVLGLLLLVNVVVHGVLSAPTPLRLIVTDPPNTFVMGWPYCWLPAFVVPCALAGHLYSLRYWLSPNGETTQTPSAS